MIRKLIGMLDLRKYSRRGQYLHRMIWLGCISASIPVILIGIVYYNFVIGKEKQQFHEANEASLALVKDRVERVLEGIEKESLQLALHPIVSQSFTAPDFRSDMYKHFGLLDTLAIMKYSNDFISDIVFYNDATGQVFSNDYGLIRYEKYKYSGDLDRLMQSDQVAQWIRMDDAGKQPGALLFARQLPIMSGGNPLGLVIVQVNANLLRSYLADNSGAFGDKSVVVLDDGYRMLIGTDNAPPIDPPLADTMHRQLETNRVLTEASSDAPYVFSQVKTAMGRTYVSMMPESAITDRLNWIRMFTVIQVVLFMMVGLILNFIVAKRNYRPIKQLINYGKHVSEGRVTPEGNDIAFLQECLAYLQNKTKALESYRTKTKRTLRERFLHKMIAGQLQGYTDAEIKSECESYGIAVHRCCAAVAVNIDNLHHLFKGSRFLPTDKPILSFAVANIMEELLARQPAKMSGYALQNNDGNGMALLQFNRELPEEEMIELACAYAESVRESVRNYLKAQVSVGIGRLYPHISDASLSHREALLALQYRFYSEAGSVLYIGHAEQTRKQAVFFYPRQIEEWLIHDLVRGDTEHAQQTLGDFAEAIRSSESYNLIYQCYHILLSSIIIALEKKGGNIVDILEYDLFNELRERKTSWEMYDWFVESLFPLFLQAAETADETAGQSNLKKVCAYIKEHLDSDISLVHCADMLKISPSYLSRMFKKEMGMSFLEFVSDCRIQEAKRLLHDTDLKVADIARAVGYSERNLNRSFMRFTQMSPRRFRELHR